ncbi:MAG: hypothetical protein LUD22_03970 [Coprobacillus sp.]|nr:hypothetical protein [Coprobacillus sp.]
MKKENILGIIVYLVILVLAVIFGLTVIQTHFVDAYMTTGQYVGFVIGALVAGIIFNAILYELGHIIGAKASHYIITSVNVLGFGWYLEGGKFKFHFKGFDGLTGETKITPQEGKEAESNPRWYLLLGTILYAIEIIVIIVFFSIYRNEAGWVSNFVYFFLIVGVVGAVIVVYNILPFRLDSLNDGYKLTMTSNKANRTAYNALLRSDYLIAQGAKDVEIPVFDEITNFTADLNLNKVYVLLEAKNYAEAEALLDQIIDSKKTVSEKTYIRTYAQKIYINLFTKSLEESHTYYEENVDQETRRLISKDNSMVSIRAYILMSGLLDRSQSECELTINKVKKAFKNTPDSRKEMERSLYNEAILKVDELHPEWGLKEHLLQESVAKKK